MCYTRNALGRAKSKDPVPMRFGCKGKFPNVQVYNIPNCLLLTSLTLYCSYVYQVLGFIGQGKQQLPCNASMGASSVPKSNIAISLSSFRSPHHIQFYLYIVFVLCKPTSVSLSLWWTYMLRLQLQATALHPSLYIYEYDAMLNHRSKLSCIYIYIYIPYRVTI